MIVLDASALLALLFGEAGGDKVASVLPEAVMSTVNLSGVLGFYVRKGADITEAVGVLSGLPITWLPFSAQQAAIAAGLVGITQAHGLSLGDRACLALAIDKGLAVYTADRVWGELSLPIPVVKIR